jgi:RNA-directed DNA polymerase
MSALEAAISMPALRAAWKRERGRLCRSCFGVDRVTGTVFESTLDRQFRELRYRLKSGFRGRGLLALAKPKDSGGFRIICVPTIADRLIQFSLLEQLRPQLKSMGLDNAISYGVARGRDRSVLEARKFACSARGEREWVYKTDIQRFFDNIGRDVLAGSIRRVVRQRSLHPLLLTFLQTEIEAGLDPDWKKVIAECGLRVGVGVRQGMPLSPFFAGTYLREIDRWILSRGVAAAQYVDDIIAFFSSEHEALAFHDALKERLSRLDLSIGEPNGAGSKTALYQPGESAAFLGMEISKSPSGPYRLQVAASTIAKVVERIDNMKHLTELLASDVRLTTMGRHFAAVEYGYLNAYAEAQNRDDLREAMSKASQAAQAAILGEIFGPERLTQLGASQWRFLGVDRHSVIGAAGDGPATRKKQDTQNRYTVPKPRQR